MAENDDFLVEIQDEFLDETMGFLEQTEQNFLELENNSQDEGILENILRLAHNIKGSAAAVGFEELSHFAHTMENLLVKIKNKEIAPTPAIIDVLLASNDMLTTYVTELQDDKSNRPDTTEVENRINAILNGENQESEVIEEEEASIESPVAEDVIDEGDIILDLETEDTPTKDDGVLSVDYDALIKLVDGENAAPPQTKEIPEAKNVTPVAKAPASTTVKKSEEFMRLPLRKIEDLLNDLSEQVILQSTLDHLCLDIVENAETVSKTIMQMGKITNELQQTAISLRMINLTGIFSKMQRTVRDTSKQLNKDIKFITVGEETEIDKTIIDELSSPITHVIRNSCDHGIETPEERTAKGKPATGTITMKASYSGRFFCLEISDDGKGIDPAVIKAKAIEKHLIKETDDLSESQIFNLIFKNGFSTKEQVTDVSGRGVGMDAVKGVVEKLRGTIEMHSEVDKGTTIVIKLPPTLAIFNGIVVTAENQFFIFPSSDVFEIFEINPEDMREMVPGKNIIRIRDTVYPIIELSKIFKLKHVTSKDEEHGKGKKVLLTVKDSDRFYGVLVDDILIQQRIVFKNLGKELEGLPGIAGGTILADGRVALIAGIEDLIAMSRK